MAEPDAFSPRALALLQRVADVVCDPVPPARVADALSSYDVFWFRLGYRLDAATLEQASRCSIVATPVTGLDHIDLEVCDRLGIRVISLQGEQHFLRDVRATAELTLALTLALSRRLPEAMADVLTGGWNRDAFRGHELFGKTVGLVGVGRLGTIVAGYFAALGMRVLGYDPHAVPASGVEYLGDLRSLVAASDVVSLHATYDRTTHHMIDAEVLAAVRPSAVLVNTARGGLIDEKALLDALRARRLAGAALDVLQDEPQITADHPLVAYAREHGNLLLVPHIGGKTEESMEKTEAFLAERVIEALRESTETGRTRSS